MKYILCQPAIKRFKWELDVCLTNLKSLGIKDIVLLFSKHDTSIPIYFEEKYNVEVHVYEDTREDKEYIPSIKPFLWWKFLEDDSSRESERYNMTDYISFDEFIDRWEFDMETATIKEGGKTPKEAFGLLAGEISKMGSDTEKASAISAIFGSTGEDAGIKVIEAMGKATQSTGELNEAYKNASGSAEKMTKDTSTPMQEMEGSIRELKDSLTPIGNDILNGMQPLIDFISDIAEKFVSLPGPAKQFIEIVGGFAIVLAILAPAIIAVAVAVTALDGALVPIFAVIGAIALVIAGIIVAYQNWGAITDWLSEKWEIFKEWAGGLWNSFKDLLGQVWDSIKLKVSEVWESISIWLSEKWEAIKLTAQLFAQGVYNWITSVWNSLKEWVTNLWNGIGLFLSTVWEGIKNVASTAVQWVVTVIQTWWNNLKNNTSNLWNGIKNVVSSIWEGIKNVASTGAQWISNTISNIWNGIKNTTSNIWNGIKGVISNVFEGAKNSVSNIADNIKNGLSNAWDNIKNIASNTWQSIKNAITGPIDSAWNTVKGIIDNIKNAFDFEWKLPEIQLPQIPTISLETSSIEILGKTISYPSGFNINWHADGGIFDRPTLLGGGHGVGEAGAEAVIPLNSKTLGGIGEGIARATSNESLGGSTVISLQINWTGDIDSPDRINQLTDKITERLTDTQRDGFH